MKKQKVDYFDDFLKERLKDPNFKRQYELEGRKLELAIRVRALRDRMSWTQTQLARKMGTSQQAISRIERGLVSNCKLSTLMKFAKATGTFLRLEFVPVKEKKAA